MRDFIEQDREKYIKYKSILIVVSFVCIIFLIPFLLSAIDHALKRWNTIDTGVLKIHLDWDFHIEKTLMGKLYIVDHKGTNSINVFFSNKNESVFYFDDKFRNNYDRFIGYEYEPKGMVKINNISFLESYREMTIVKTGTDYEYTEHQYILTTKCYLDNKPYLIAITMDCENSTKCFNFVKNNIEFNKNCIFLNNLSCENVSGKIMKLKDEINELSDKIKSCEKQLTENTYKVKTNKNLYEFDPYVVINCGKITLFKSANTLYYEMRRYNNVLKKANELQQKINEINSILKDPYGETAKSAIRHYLENKKNELNKMIEELNKLEEKYKKECF